MGLIIRCPSCPRQLRVPEELLGQDVKCPSCGAVFKASEDMGQPAPTPPEEKGLDLEPPAKDASGEEVTERPGEAPPRGTRGRAGYGRRDDDEDFGSDDYDDRPRGRRYGPDREAARARVSGPATALSVAGGLGLGLALLSLCLGAPAMMDGGGHRNADPAYMMGRMVGAGIAVVWGIFVLIGAHKMKTLESYGLAMTGAIVAMLPCNGCCLLGLPFGIWALVVLSNAEVKDAFR
jgi:predicted Zn finger-like uncharacterized protein